MATTKKTASSGKITLTIIDDQQALRFLRGPLAPKDRTALIERLIASKDAEAVYHVLRQNLYQETENPEQLKTLVAERLLKDGGKKSLMLVVQNFKESRLRDRAISAFAADPSTFTYVLDRWRHHDFTPTESEKIRLLSAIMENASPDQCATILNLDRYDLDLAAEQRMGLMKRRFVGPEAAFNAFDCLRRETRVERGQLVKSPEERAFLLDILVNDPGYRDWSKGYFAMFLLTFNQLFPVGDFRHFALTQAEQKLLLPPTLYFLLSEQGYSFKEERIILLEGPLRALLCEEDRLQLSLLQMAQAA
jgi:hypothetical protein